MAKRKLITQDQKNRIADLLAKGLSDSEVAGALKINSETVRKFRLDNNIVAKKEVGKIDGSIKNNKAGHTSTGAAEKGRDRNPSDHQCKEGSREPEHNTPDDHTDGKTICFTGGKRHGGDTLNKEKEESFEWECPACHNQWNGSAEKCPKCGKLLQE